MTGIQLILPHLTARAPAATVALVVIVILSLLVSVTCVVGIRPFIRRLERDAGEGDRRLVARTLRSLLRVTEDARRVFMAIGLIGGPILLWITSNDPGGRELSWTFLAGIILPLYVAASCARSEIKAYTNRTTGASEA
jgi:hypothetical protein